MRAFEALPWSVERVVSGEAAGAADQVEPLVFEPRLHLITTDKRDSGGGTNNIRGAWRNPMLLLPEVLRVQMGDTIVVETEIQRLGEKGPAYKVAITHERDGQQIAAMSESYTQKDLFPWTRRKSAA